MSRRLTKNGRQYESGSGEGSKSLNKALRILVYFGDNGPEFGVTELAAALRLNKSTTYRLLHAMVRFGLIEQDVESEKYRLGLKLFELGNRAMQSRTLQGQARPYLIEMSRLTNETVHLGVTRDGDVIYLDKIESHDTMVSIPSAIGRRLPAHCTGLGKALLAHLPQSELLKILSLKGLPKRTENTITDRTAFYENLEQIRQRGYALDNQEIERGLSCVAIPVRGHQGRVVAAISISGPAVRFRGKELTCKIDIGKKIAKKISAGLGYKSYERPL